MKQLIYSSKSKPNVKFEDVKTILNIANNMNKEFGLSGMLIYNGTYFLQCIEGDEVYVKTLYNNILKDKRHFDIKKIDMIDIEQRDFGQWAMGYYHSKKQVNEFMKNDNFDPYDMSFTEARNLLIRFSKGLM